LVSASAGAGLRRGRQDGLFSTQPTSDPGNNPGAFAASPYVA
jgi:hypothetical protein